MGITAGSVADEFSLTTQQVTHPIKSAVSDLDWARRAHRRLRMESHAQSGLRHHRQIIGPIAYCDAGIGGNTESAGQRPQRLRFLFAIHNRGHHPASHLSRLYLERISDHLVKSVIRLQTPGNRDKATGKNGQLDAPTL